MTADVLVKTCNTFTRLVVLDSDVDVWLIATQSSQVLIDCLQALGEVLNISLSV